MAHELEIKANGEASMFYAGQTPWHGLGTAVETEVTSGAAIRLAGLDWEVEKRPMYIAGSALVDGIPVLGNAVPRRYATVRKEDNAVLGVVGESYEIIQNADAFDFLDSLVGEGLAMYHTAGSLFGGSQIFICCKLPDAITVGPDRIDRYLIACTSHDRTLSLQVKWSPIRVVCNNTLSAALGGRGGSDTVAIPHFSNWQANADKAREILGLADLYYSRLEEVFERLRRERATVADARDFAEKLYPVKVDGDGNERKLSKQTRERREQVVRLFDTGLGNGHPDVRRTRWALYNAVTEQTDHHRSFGSGSKGTPADSRFQSVLYGAAARTKQRALELLTT